MTKVVHCKKESYDIYIGRKKDTNKHYGNPFRIGDWGVSREESIKRFRLWIMGHDYQNIEPEQRKWILENLKNLKNKTLGCWCKPKACHGDVLVELINEELEK